MEAVRGLQNRAVDSGESVMSQSGRGGKGKSKGERRAEERSRSISFKGFPENTRSDNIKQKIEQ
eukprot:102799-Karenia_brevis.AAC.1